MPKTNMGLQSGTAHIAKMSFETEKIHALGGPELFPKLVFLFDVRLSPWTDISKQTNIVHPVTWLTLFGEFCSPEQRPVAMFRDELNLYADTEHSPETQFRLEIPLDLFTVARIEQLRDGDLRAALNFRAMFAIHLSGALGVERFEAAEVEPLVFTIPKSHWVDKLLPQLGYGKIELIEVSIPDGIRGQGLPEAVKKFGRHVRTSLMGIGEKLSPTVVILSKSYSILDNCNCLLQVNSSPRSMRSSTTTSVRNWQISRLNCSRRK